MNLKSVWMRQWFVGMTAAVWLGTAGAAAAEPPDVLRASGIKGGIVVHLGCGDGRLTSALRAGERYTVHGLEADEAKVAAAREHVRGLGLYGAVSVERFDGATLPYTDNLVNLVVVEDAGGVSESEILRVLAPGGVACRKAGGGWTKTVKPRPPTIDEWSHFLHDAGNNAVARDEAVGPPRALQWIAPPLWLRSHETPSGVEACVISGGRLFYFFDEGVVGITDKRLPERWSLVCRDAFNGRFLWKRPLEKWGWPLWAADKFGGVDWTTITGARTVVPDQNQRRLVADGDRLYATLSFDAPLSILDAATGETMVTIDGTAPVREIAASGGVVVAYSGPAEAPARERPGKGRKGKAAPVAAPAAAALRGVDGRTGTVLWKADIPPINALSLTIDRDRVTFLSSKNLSALGLRDGRKLWETAIDGKRVRTLVAHDGCIVIVADEGIEARDGAAGALLWKKEIPLAHGPEGTDLFVIDGVVWPGALSVDQSMQPTGKSADVLAIGYDLRTGEERKRVAAKELRSPEHHHRCYRNKATCRYIITSMEGAEFLDLQGDGHSQNNFLRGACKFGMLPANGLLYVPPDQCFCQPGAKVLGFTAVAAAPARALPPVSDAQRLEKGPAFAANPTPHAPGLAPSPADWPTFRHDAARHGSTASAVPAGAAPEWRVKPGGPLTAPVAAGGRVYVASRDAHTVHAIAADTGKLVWSFVAGGRIDSPPTVHAGLVLFGSADGRVYCLRAGDGALAWRFLAAPMDRRIAAFDQIESLWPVHGSVLIHEGTAYFTAGRSTYLDGGIRIYGLDPLTGRVLHQGLLDGPWPEPGKGRDVAFYISGANSDVLVSEGGALYMRQKRLTPALEEVKPPLLSTKGEADAGLHLFSTGGLLDASGYNRIFWMYTKRWPGFQLANQAPKSGQILVVDGENTYGVNGFYRRNVHSPMFFPAKEGYLVFADKNTTEPQIVGEEGSRPPVPWLPQSDYPRRDGVQKLDAPAFGLDKMIGYTRADPPLWTRWLPVRVRAMVKAGDTLFAAGPPDELDEKDPLAAFEGRRGARLVALDAKSGKQVNAQALDAPPVFDGMIAAGGRLLIALEDGSLVSLK